MLAKRLAEVIHAHRGARAAIGCRKRETNFARRGVELHRLHLLELANAALNLSRLARLGAETPHELLEVFLFLFQVLRAVLEKLPLFLALREVPLVVPAKGPDAFRLEADDSVRPARSEIPYRGRRERAPGRSCSETSRTMPPTACPGGWSARRGAAARVFETSSDARTARIFQPPLSSDRRRR